MGNNNCIGSRVTKDGLFQTISSSIWWSRSTDSLIIHSKRENAEELPFHAQCKPPKHLKIVEEETKQATSPPKPKEGATEPSEIVMKVKEERKPAQPASDEEEKKPAVPTRPNKTLFKRTPRAGLQENSVLKTRTGHLKEYYNLGRKLGHGQFGTTFLCVEKATGKEYACKSISKEKLLTSDDVDDVRREIQIMHHLAGHPNVVSIKGAYEDAMAVHVVMELCAGGELFERIIERGHYTERKAAQLTRTIVGVIESCHSLGVMHRDLKPENFLFVNESEDSPLKAIDFGFSVFFKPGDILNDVVGSPYYVAPEVLRRRYGPEADVWSAGVMVYILLCGVPPFWAENEHDIFEEVLHGDLDFTSDPWPNISSSAKDLVRRMLVRDPKKRLTAHEVLCHPWVHDDGVAPDKPLDPAVFSYFDKDGSGYITIDELQQACNEFGMDDIHLEEMIREVDQDNDGSIDYSEFVAMMRKGNAELGKNGVEGTILGIGFREELSVY